MQAMIDVCADEGWLSTVLQIIILMQMVVQGRWHYDSPLLQLPKVNEDLLQKFVKKSRMRQVFRTFWQIRRYILLLVE